VWRWLRCVTVNVDLGWTAGFRFIPIRTGGLSGERTCAIKFERAKDGVRYELMVPRCIWAETCDYHEHRLSDICQTLRRLVQSPSCSLAKAHTSV